MADTKHHNVAENIHHLIQQINAKAVDIDRLVSGSHSSAQEYTTAELQRIFNEFEHVDKHKYAHHLGEWLKVLNAEFPAVEAEGNAEATQTQKDTAKYEYGVAKVAYYDAFPNPGIKNEFPSAHKY